MHVFSCAKTNRGKSTVSVHVLQIHVLQIHLLQIHVLQIHVLQILLLQIHVLLIQSSPYFTTCPWLPPIFFWDTKNTCQVLLSPYSFKPHKNIPVLVSTTHRNPSISRYVERMRCNNSRHRHLFCVPIGCVRFARFCGKMHNRHLFPYGGSLSFFVESCLPDIH